MNEIQFVLYSMPGGNGKVQVIIKDETIWCTQKAMAQLFGVGVPAISKHLSHIFEEGELEKEKVVSKMEISTQHGAIESKDYFRELLERVRSIRASERRIWQQFFQMVQNRFHYAITGQTGRLKRNTGSSTLDSR